VIINSSSNFQHHNAYQNWSQALSQLDIYFEGRLDSVLEI